MLELLNVFRTALNRAVEKLRAVNAFSDPRPDIRMFGQEKNRRVPEKPPTVLYHEAKPLIY